MEKKSSREKILTLPALEMITRIVEDKAFQSCFFQFEQHLDLFGTEITQEQYLVQILDYGKRELKETNSYENSFSVFFEKYLPFIQAYAVDDITKWYRNPIAEECTCYFSVCSEEAAPFRSFDTACIASNFFGRCISFEDVENKFSVFEKKFAENETLSKNELEQIIVLITDYDVIGERSEVERARYFEYILHNLLETKERISSVHYQKYIGAYLLGITDAYHLSTMFFYDKNLPEGERGNYVFDEDMMMHCIRFDPLQVTHKNVLSNLEVVFHEVDHALKEKDFSTVYDYMSHRRIKDDLLRRRLGEDFYDQNYFDISFEGEARYQSNIHLLRLIERVSKKTYDVYHEMLLGEIKAGCMARNAVGRLDASGDYRHLDILFEDTFSKEEIAQMRTHPEYGKIFQLEYNEEGYRKSILDFVKERREFLESTPVPTQSEEKRMYYQRLCFYGAMINRSGYTDSAIVHNFRKIIFSPWENLELSKDLMDLLPFFRKNMNLDRDFSGIYSDSVEEGVRHRLYREREEILQLASKDPEAYLLQEKVWSKKYSFCQQVQTMLHQNLADHKIIPFVSKEDTVPNKEVHHAHR